MFEDGRTGGLVGRTVGNEDRWKGLLRRRMARIVAWWSEIAFHLERFQNTAGPRPNILRGARALSACIRRRAQRRRRQLEALPGYYGSQQSDEHTNRASPGHRIPF